MVDTDFIQETIVKETSDMSRATVRLLCPTLAVFLGTSLLSPKTWSEELKPHPDAIANAHAPGEVDNPELVPLIVTDPKHLEGIVVDETAATLVGSWQYSTHTPPYVGLGYLHDQKKGKGESSVTFVPHLPTSGTYEVRLSHCYNVRRSTNSPVTIHHADGDTLIRINQQETPEHGRLFRSLGEYRFEAGCRGFVRIANDGTEGKYVIADAVQFIPISGVARAPSHISDSVRPAKTPAQ